MNGQRVQAISQLTMLSEIMDANGEYIQQWSKTRYEWSTCAGYISINKAISQLTMLSEIMDANGEYIQQWAMHGTPGLPIST